MPLLRERNRGTHRLRAILVFSDLTGIALSFVLAFLVRFKLTGFPYAANLGLAHWWMLTGAGLAAVVIFGLHRLYDEEVYSRRLNQLPKIGRALLILFGMLFVLSFFLKSEVFFERRSIPLLSFTFTFLLVSSFRLILFHRIYRSMLGKGVGVTNVAIVGERQGAEELAQKILGFDTTRYRLVCILTQPSQLADLLRNRKVDEIFLTSFPLKETIDMASQCRDMRVGVNVVSDVFGVFTGKVDTELIDGLPLIRLNSSSNGSFPKILKRITDFTISLLTLLLLSPLLLLISMGIKLTSKGPVFFRQTRVGERGRQFTFYKFRSMFDNADSTTHRRWVKSFISNRGRDANGVQKMTRDERVTKFGYFLRRTSLDELPQLINVLRGEMSLIGPRPPIPYEAKLYETWHKKRLKAKPGITGLWQVSARSSVSFSEMVLLDIYYAENWSLGLDLEILLKTVPVVISRRGAF